MSRNKVLNFILRWLNTHDGICTKSFTEIIEPNFPEISPQKHDEFISKLKIDSHIETRTGFGKWNFEIHLTDNGRTFITTKGYREYSDEVLSLINNEKALDFLVNKYNECYYANITFDIFYNDQLQRMIDKKICRSLIGLLFKQGLLEGLPKDFILSSKNSGQSPLNEIRVAKPILSITKKSLFDRICDLFVESVDGIKRKKVEYVAQIIIMIIGGLVVGFLLFILGWI